MFERFLTASSTYARDIDYLILLVLVFVGVWFILAELVFLGLIVKFRAKDGVKSQYISGEEKHQKRWVAWPHYLVLVCDVFILVAALKVWTDIKISQPEAEAKVRIVAQQWAWSFVHDGADGKLDTDDDIRTVEELHVEVGKTYHFLLESRDVLHSFSVPAFRLKQDAIPGREITGWFNATRTGDFDIQCAEICGVAHGIMSARIIVDSKEDYAAWVAKGGPTAYWAASNVKSPSIAKPAAAPAAPTVTATTAALLPL
jgi:cytochrome c oxidase subunit 2